MTMWFAEGVFVVVQFHGKVVVELVERLCIPAVVTYFWMQDVANDCAV